MATSHGEFVAAAPVALDLDVQWIDGTDPDEPRYQIHQIETQTFVIRQSLRVSAEAPFIYLLFGDSRALLIDTGATEDPTAWPLREVVDQLIEDWLTAHPRPDYELVVAHSHGHQDHTAGDDQFHDRPQTTVVSSELAAIVDYFGFSEWPSGTAGMDLGRRELLLLPSPGHHEAAITFYDPWTGVLFTGDTVYPGRLFVKDMQAFESTIGRLAALTGTKPVSHILGCHIELSRHPGKDYPLGAREHPDERPLPMTVPQLRAVHATAAERVNQPGVHIEQDFILYNGMRIRDHLKLLIRSRSSPLRVVLAAVVLLIMAGRDWIADHRLFNRPEKRTSNDAGGQ